MFTRPRTFAQVAKGDERSEVRPDWHDDERLQQSTVSMLFFLYCIRILLCTLTLREQTRQTWLDAMRCDANANATTGRAGGGVDATIDERVRVFM